ncbi:hypothetical protein THIAE_01725 [Thiomicrospira aerophila AL3]|uniref:Uncharacterized protein n=1 Tax=Thiomicrospira aerophila AL3 TaxID=717772 RepID=W0DZC4_9GAMM|nr:hypothetical protein [Thiomicrospira aerophila]AHF02181.1 hypothetical protein THIAE_01725 [Thiomicrospira aerophila AL3]
MTKKQIHQNHQAWLKPDKFIEPFSRSHVPRGNADQFEAELKKNLGGIGYVI